METSSLQKSISELTLQELFPTTLTDVSCVYIDKGEAVWVATEMCAQYLESTIDSIVVRDNGKAIGIIGGYDLLDHLRNNPTRDFQYRHKVEEVMFKDYPQIEKKTKFKDLMEKWKETRRAFAITPKDSNDYSPISARKMLEVGTKFKTDISISSMPKKKIITFEGDEPLSKILDLMFENKTRKILLANSNQFISDRTILEGLSRIIKFQKDVDNFLDVPINQVTFDHIKTITEDLNLNQLCSIMNKMEHPFVIYKDIIISPWDVCLTLATEDIADSAVTEYQKKITCPHCGKDVSV